MAKRDVKAARKLIQRPILDDARADFFYWLEEAIQVRSKGFLFEAEKDDYYACIYYMRQEKLRGMVGIP